MNISFEEINDLKDKGAVAFYDGEFKKSYRIVVPYNNKVYAIFWFEVSSDGSLYCGIRDRQSKRMANGVLECQDGTLTVKYSDMDFKSKPTKDRISFHASGEIYRTI